MADYYAILSVDKKATTAEIKAAFRKLAKIYHPDKNPNNTNAKALFEQILTAYNVLSNQYTRKRYDDLHFNTSQKNHQNQSIKTKKEWTFTDEDLKRREYYKNHYKAKERVINNIEQKPKHNDFKYILIATPISIGLLMLIVSFFSNEPVTVDAKPIKQETAIKNTTTVFIKNGDTPYRGVFGSIKTFNTSNKIELSNESNCDAVICLYNAKTNLYLQHTFLQSSYSVEFKNLPNDGVYWKCFFGKNWNPDVVLKDTILGGFDSIVQYQNWIKKPINFYEKNEKTSSIINVININSKLNNFICTEQEFFKYKYQSHDKKNSF